MTTHSDAKAEAFASSVVLFIFSIIANGIIAALYLWLQAAVLVPEFDLDLSLDFGQTYLLLVVGSLIFHALVPRGSAR